MKQFWAIIGIMALIIIGGIIIFAIDWGGSGGTKSPIARPKPLGEYATTDAKLRMRVRGPVINDQEHRELSITVGHDTVEAVVYQGYQDKVIKEKSYRNNFDAYNVFLSAMINSGFTNRQPANPAIDVAGVCQTGKLYSFDIIDIPEDEDTPESSWVSGCSKKTGTFAGNLSAVRRLFETQVPDYNKFISKTGY